MKKFFLGKFNYKSWDGTFNDGYSIFENTNEELRTKIKNFKIDKSKVTLGWPERTWNVSELEGEEYKCTDGKNVQFFPIAKVEKAWEDMHQYSLNQEYPPYKYFKSCFGKLSSTFKDERHYSLKKIDLKEDEQHSIGKGELDPTKVEFYWSFDRYSVYESNDYIEIEATIQRGSSLNLFFNNDGNFVNRDYNENLIDYKIKDVPPSTVLDQLKKMLNNIEGNIEECKGKFYTNKFCYVPYCYYDEADPNTIKLGFDKIPAEDKEGMSYKAYRVPRIKKPKTRNDSNSEAMFQTIIDKFPTIYKEIFNVNEVLA